VVRKLRGIYAAGYQESGPGVAGVAVDGGLQIDLAHALEGPDEESVDGNEGFRVCGASIVAFAELRSARAAWSAPR
jgi:hypothetical protein